MQKPPPGKNLVKYIIEQPLNHQLVNQFADTFISGFQMVDEFTEILYERLNQFLVNVALTAKISIQISKLFNSLFDQKNQLISLAFYNFLIFIEKSISIQQFQTQLQQFLKKHISIEVMASFKTFMQNFTEKKLSILTMAFADTDTAFLFTLFVDEQLDQFDDQLRNQVVKLVTKRGECTLLNKYTVHEKTQFQDLIVESDLLRHQLVSMLPSGYKDAIQQIGICQFIIKCLKHLVFEARFTWQQSSTYETPQEEICYLIQKLMEITTFQLPIDRKLFEKMQQFDKLALSADVYLHQKNIQMHSLFQSSFIQQILNNYCITLVQTELFTLFKANQSIQQFLILKMIKLFDFDIFQSTKVKIVLNLVPHLNNNLLKFMVHKHQRILLMALNQHFQQQTWVSMKEDDTMQFQIFQQDFFLQQLFKQQFSEEVRLQNNEKQKVELFQDFFDEKQLLEKLFLTQNRFQSKNPIQKCNLLNQFNSFLAFSDAFVGCLQEHSLYQILCQNFVVNLTRELLQSNAETTLIFDLVQKQAMILQNQSKVHHLILMLRLAVVCFESEQKQNEFKLKWIQAQFMNLDDFTEEKQLFLFLLFQLKVKIQKEEAEKIIRAKTDNFQFLLIKSFLAFQYELFDFTEELLIQNTLQNSFKLSKLQNQFLNFWQTRLMLKANLNFELMNQQLFVKLNPALNVQKEAYWLALENTFNFCYLKPSGEFQNTANQLLNQTDETKKHNLVKQFMQIFTEAEFAKVKHFIYLITEQTKHFQPVQVVKATFGPQLKEAAYSNNSFYFIFEHPDAMQFVKYSVDSENSIYFQKGDFNLKTLINQLAKEKTKPLSKEFYKKWNTHIKFDSTSELGGQINHYERAEKIYSIALDYGE